jgi:phosphohistidine phosphatase SixA
MITVLFVRHADIDLPPASPNPSLNLSGHARAEGLVHVAGRAGVNAIFTSSYARTKETVAPLAARLGLQAREAPTGLIDDLLSGPDGAVVLIAGHSNTVPQMIAALGVPPPLPVIGESDFDNLFVVTAIATTGQAALVNLKYGREDH